MVCVWSANAAASQWCFAEPMARATGKNIFPFVISSRRDVAPLRRQSKRRRNSRLRRGVRASRPRTGRGGSRPHARVPRDPRTGAFSRFRAFEMEDAAFFFGREREIRETCTALEELRHAGRGGFCLLVGHPRPASPPCCGRASLARLQKAPNAWAIVKAMRPQGGAVDQLAARLTGAAVEPAIEWDGPSTDFEEGRHRRASANVRDSHVGCR
jgi:hypothetical protein